MIEDISQKSKKTEEELMNKNLNWAQENNNLTNQLLETEKQLIEAKVHIANVSSMNDKLKHSNNEKQQRAK